jgi:predicted enzyme related to lactoylglutathione lyase
MVTHLGGVFIYSEKPAELAQWYEKHLGIKTEAAPDGSVHYTQYFYNDIAEGKKRCVVWSINKSKDRPGTDKKYYTVNYRVHDIEKLASQLRAGGVEVKGVEDYPGMGKFAWCRDPEGNYIELWEDTGTHEE